jgi:hypothetical protein
VKLPTLLALAAVVAGARPADAQMVVQPQAKLNPTQTSVRNELYRLRDRLLPVGAALARLPRDMRTASDASLQSRARLVTQRCSGALAGLDSVRAIIAEQPLPDPDPQGVHQELLRAMDRLRGGLTQCVQEFRGLSEPARTQELRDYGIGRGQRIENTILEYEPTVQRYFRLALGIAYSPNVEGAGSIPPRR